MFYKTDAKGRRQQITTGLTRRGKRSIMNKLLLLALFSACFVIITHGIEQVEETNVAELVAGDAEIREAREADPKKKEKDDTKNQLSMVKIDMQIHNLILLR